MLERLYTLFSSLRSPSGSSAKALRTTLQLEALEDRMVPLASVANSLFPPQNGVSFIDRLYLTQEAQGDQQEIILGQLAMQNGSSGAVKLFGYILYTDHLNSLNEIKPVLQDAGIPVPSLSLQNIQNIQPFIGLSGQKFDNQFTTFMVQDHIQDVEITLAEEQVGTFPEAQAFAVSALPVLDTHLLIALALQPGGQSSSSSS
jgi:predicted outer membrane protein